MHLRKFENYIFFSLQLFGCLRCLVHKWTKKNDDGMCASNARKTIPIESDIIYMLQFSLYIFFFLLVCLCSFARIIIKNTEHRLSGEISRKDERPSEWCTIFNLSNGSFKCDI